MGTSSILKSKNQHCHTEKQFKLKEQRLRRYWNKQDRRKLSRKMRALAEITDRNWTREVHRRCDAARDRLEVNC